MKPKFKIGETIRVTDGVDFEITKLSTFSGCEHYGGIFTNKVPCHQNKYEAGFIPVFLLDKQGIKY